MKTVRRSGDAAILVTFCVFILSVFTALILGVGAYQNITRASRSGYDERLCLSYIWTKVKTGDEAGKVYTGEFHGLPALFIDEEYGGGTHHTVIYHYDGWVYELFAEAGHDHLPRDGIPVVRNESLLPEQLGNGLIRISAGEESMVLSLRSGTADAGLEGGGPE
ncbi:MAG: DUF4860 domain-containing protein [Oscillospiraceae bacterium]|nr:DUF4860 domain-containing protein [Oscillospiraceae bacterium]